MDAKIKDREEKYMGKQRREKHLPPLQKLQEGKYPQKIIVFLLFSFRISFIFFNVSKLLLLFDNIKRYENVIADFEKRRAERRGTKLPPGELLDKWKKQTQKKRAGNNNNNRNNRRR